jgi:hypothetical protein
VLALAPGGRGLRLAPAVTVLSCAAFLALCWVLRGFVTDDAWISVRYAENLASGAGAVWNPGGPRVEGFSNPLLVCLEAAAAVAGWSAVSAARTLGVLSGLACIVLVHRAGRAVVGEPAAVVGALLTGVSAPFALWAVGGLETTTTAAVLTAAVCQVARADGGRAVLAGALLALLPWLRPEGLVLALALAVLGEAPRLRRPGARAASARRLAVVGGLPLLSQGALEAARLAVYGHLLPNSVLYKSGTGETFSVLQKFLGQSLLVVGLAVVGVLLLRGRPLLLAVPLGVYVVGSLGTLDSVNAFSRFFMPVHPQLALLAGAAVAGLAGRLVAGAGRRTVAAAVLAVVVATVASVAPPAGLRDVHRWQQGYTTCRVAARVEAADWLLTNTPSETTFAISDAGYVPARAGGRTAVDNFMLNDPLIQRTGPLTPGQRADVVHERRPDVLILASREPNRFDPLYATDAALRTHPQGGEFSQVHLAGGDSRCAYHLVVLAR